MAWYNPTTWGKDIVKRAYSGENFPDRVFVGYDGNQLPGGGLGYEISDLPPAKLADWNIDDLLYGAYGRQNFITLFYCLPEIFAPVNEIASRVSDAVWELKKFSNDEIDYSNKTFNKLFSQPNVLMSHKQLVYQSVCYEILTGANFQYFNKPSSLADSYENILGWSNVPTHHLCIEKNKTADVYSATSINDLVKSYELKEGKTTRDMPVKNVLPFIDFDLHCGNEIDKFRSRLEGAKLAIKNLIPVYEARGVIYVKRGALGFLVSKKSDVSGLVSLTPNEKKEAQEAYQGTYGLNRGKELVSVASAPVEYINTSMSIQELQPFDETLADAVAIYAALRVPRHLVPTKDNSTFANASADLKSFYDDVIIPMAEKRGQSWTNYFNIPARYIKPNYSHISVLQENRKEKADVAKTDGSVWLERWQNGVCTLNDWITAIDGEKGTGVIYEKKIFDLSEEEVKLVKNIINLKSNGITPENKGTQTQSSTN